MSMKSRWPSLSILVLAGALAASSAAAQTVLSPVPADPATLRLQERVEQLEQQLRDKTGELERLNFEISRTQQDVARLNKLLDDVLANGGVAGQPSGLGNQVFPSAVAQAQPAASIPPAVVTATPPVNEATRQAAYRGARELLLASDYPGAERAFRAFLKDYGASPEAADATYWLGQTLLGQDKYSEAAKQFLEVVQKFGGSERAPDAFVRLGTSLNRLGRTREACLTFKDLPNRFPKASQAVKDFAAREAKAAACPA